MRTLVGSEHDTDQEWHLRSMRYGDGWAYDSTQSHYKRAKPTYTDPEDDRTTDSSLPLGRGDVAEMSRRLCLTICMLTTSSAVFFSETPVFDAVDEIFGHRGLCGRRSRRRRRSNPPGTVIAKSSRRAGPFG